MSSDPRAKEKCWNRFSLDSCTFSLLLGVFLFFVLTVFSLFSCQAD